LVNPNEFRENMMRAVQQTKVVRWRQSNLYVGDETELPYVLVSESEFDPSDTVVRKGAVKVSKPRLIIPQFGQDEYEFEGFGDDEENPHFVAMGRMTAFPKGKYSMVDCTMEVVERRLPETVEMFVRGMTQEEDEKTGLCICPSEIWMFALFHYVGGIIVHSAQADISDFERRGFLGDFDGK